MVNYSLSSPLAPQRVRFAPQNRLLESAECNFFEIHSKIATFCKTYIPFIDVAGQIIKKILKEV